MKLLRCVPLVLAFSLRILAQGADMVSSMPPGGEGPASVALGVAVPGGLPSMEVNPALLAWEGARTSSVLQFSSTTSELLPELKMDDPIEETVRSVGLRWPMKPGTDVALGYSWHEIDYGRTDLSDSMGEPTGRSVNSTERSHRMVLAGRLGGIASIGVGMNWLDLRPAPGIIEGDDESGTAEALTWSLGLMVAPRWKIPGTLFRIGPSLGVSWINPTEESVSLLPGKNDPLGCFRRWGVAGEISAQDLVVAQVFLDEEVDMTYSDRYDAVQWTGWSVELLGVYRRSSADLTDPYGQRSETQTSDEFIFDLKSLSRLWWRLRAGDFTDRVEDVPEGYPLPSWTVFGAVLTPNLRASWVRSEIEGHDFGKIRSVRNGQERFAWSITL